MADGVNIDTLEIEVEASSKSAVEKINALTESLRNLQAVTKQKFGNIFKQIDGIGDSASAAQKKVHEKKEILNRATGKSSRPVEFDAAKAVKGIKSLDKEISNTEKNIARLRAQIEAIESAKVTTENPSAELFFGFDSQIEKAKEALKEQSDVLSALQSQQKSLRDSLREGMASMGVGGSFDQTGEDVEELAGKMQDLASTAKETAQSLDLRKTLRDSLYGDIKERTDEIRDSLRDAKDEFGQFSDFINYAPGVEGLEGAQDYAKEIREQFKAATYAAKEAKQELAQYSTLNQPISDSQISAFVKAQNAVDALKEKYAKLKAEFSELPELPDFNKIKGANLQEAQNTVSEIKKQMEDIGKAEIQPPDMKALQKELDSLKGTSLDQLKRMLASAELQAVKTDGKLAEMRRTLDGLQDTPGFEAVEKDLQDFADKAEHLKSYIDDFKRGIKVLSAYNPDLSMPGVGDEIRASREELKRFVDSYQAVNNAAKIAGETAKNSMAELKAAAKSSASDSKEPAAPGAFGRLQEIKREISKLDFGPVKKLGDAFKDLGNSILGAAKNLGRFALALPRKALSGIADGAKAVGRSIADRFTKPFKTAIGAFEKWKSKIGSIMFYRAIRSAIKAVTDGFKTGMENLYQYSRLVGTEFAPAMDRLATSSLYLKNSLGAMAAPLIQALAPAVDFIIDKFVALFNIIGKVFAALTGKSVYTQAKKHAVEYGEAANKASKATKDFLLGIDELNVLNDNAGGAGGAASDFGDMFEEVEVPNEISDWAAKVREAIENGEWRQVGEIIADKLNEIVDNWDSYAWGKKLGGLINNGLNVAYGFLTEFSFENLGLKVADFFNGIFDKVDWDLLGRTFAAGWNGLMAFIYGLIDGFHWDVFGKAVADAIIGFFSEIDWGLPILILKAGIDAVRDALVGFLSEFGDRLDLHGITDPLIEIVNTVADTLQKVVDLTVEWFKNLDFTPILHAFESLLSAIAPLVETISVGLLWAYGNVLLPLGKWTIEEAVPGIVNFLAEAFETLVEALRKVDFGPIIEATKELFETFSPLVELISDALLWAFENVLVPLGQWVIEEAAPASVDALTKAFEAVSEIAKTVIDVIKTLYETFKPVIDFIKETAVKVIELLGDTFGKIAELFNEKGEKIVNILDGVGKAISILWGIAEPILTTLRETVGAVFQFIGDIVSTTIGAVIDVLDGLVTFIEGVFTGDWEKAWEGVKNIFKGIWNGIVGLLESAINFMIRTINGFIRGLNKIQIPDWVPAIGGKGFNINELSEVHIPRLAKGGILDKGQLFIAREAGPELVGKIGKNSAVANNLQILEGIKQGVYEGVLAANKARSIVAELEIPSSFANVLRDIEPVQPQYAVRQNPYATMPAAFAQAQSAGASIANYNSTTTTVSNDNGDVIAALNAGFQALIETINSQDYSTHLDGKTLMQSVERAQKNRGVNIMGGGVLG